MAGVVTGATELIAVSAIRGGKKPLLVNFTSSPAEGSGLLPSLFTLTWLNALNPGITKICECCNKKFKSREKYCSRKCKDLASIVSKDTLLTQIRERLSAVDGDNVADVLVQVRAIASSTLGRSSGCTRLANSA